MINEDKFPENWDIKKMDEICGYIQRGKQPKYDDENGQVGIINQRCVYWEKFDMNSVRYLDKEDEDSWQDYRYLQDGDVLLTSTGDGTLGRANVWRAKNDRDYVVDGHITILRPDSNILPMYLYYFLWSPYGQDQIFRYEKGSTSQTELYKGDVVDIDVPVPPLDEQERIVSVVEERLERVERLEKSVENIGRLSEEYQDSLRALLILGMSEEGVENIGNDLREEHIPDDWSVKNVSDIVKAKNGGTPKKSNDEYWDGRINWINSGEVRGKYTGGAEDTITQKGLEETSAKMFPEDSVLIAMYGGKGTIGRSTIVSEPISGNQAICCLEVNKDMATPEYLYYYTMIIRDKLEKLARGASQDNINQSIILNQKIPIPPIETQKDIVNNIENYNFKKVKKSAEVLDKLFDEYRSSILSHAFQGDIDY